MFTDSHHQPRSGFGYRRLVIGITVRKIRRNKERATASWEVVGTDDIIERDFRAFLADEISVPFRL